MGDDESPTPLEPPRRDEVAAPPPWERRRAVSPAPAPPAEAPDPATAEAPRRSLASDQDEQVSVAELLRRVGPRAGGRGRRHGRADPPTSPDPGRPAGAAPPPTPTSGRHLAPERPRPGLPPAAEDDTAVLPVVVDDVQAPLGGAPLAVRPPRPTPQPRTRPGAGRVVALPEPAETEVAVPTRLQAKKSRRQRRTALGAKVAAVLAAVLVLAVTGTAWSALHYVDANQQTVQALDQGSAAVVEPGKQLGDENFLLIGSDSRAGASGDVGAGTESQVGGARSDTAILAHVPADRSRIVLVSFPRDLQVNLPACNRWNNDSATYSNEVVPPQTGVKLNAAYFEGGPRCITKVVQQLSGLNVNHFLGVDFSGFQSMVDAVGGVQVCTEKPLKDTILGTVLAKAGTQTINGQQALNYVRARHVVGDPTSDYGRIKRQQRFLASLLRAALSTNTLLNVGRLKNLVDAVTANTFGDNVGVQQLLTIAQSMPNLGAGRVTFITAPTTGRANAAGNEVLLPQENAALFQSIREGWPLPGEASAPSTPTPAPPTSTAPPALLALAPADVSFVVRNATGTTGLAARVATELAGHGFHATATNNYPVPATRTVVRYSAGAEAAAATLASSVPGATLEAATGLGGTVELVLGTRVLGTTTAPTPAGSPLPSAGAPAAPAPTTPLPSNLAVVNGGDATCT